MKIAIATAVYYPMTNGVATFSHNLATGLARRGHEVMVICPSQTGKNHTEMIDGVKAAGFNTVRIPVFWGNMMKNDGTWTINAAYIGRVKEIVDYCMNDDLYAVVNIHLLYPRCLVSCI